MNDNSFDVLLDSCLDALLAGEWTLEECLQQYPDHAADLKPALQMALLTAHLKQPAMSSESVAALEMRLKGQMLAQQSPRRRSATALLPISRLVATIAIVLLITVGAGGGAVAASAHAMPGDFLYGLKRLWEAIILALSSLTNATGATWLHLAEMRLDEVDELARRGIIDESLLVDLYEATANTLLLVDNGSETQVVAYVTEARIRLIDLPVRTEPSTIHTDLIDLLTTDNGLQRPAFTTPPSLAPALVTLPPPPTSTGTMPPSATFTPTPTVTPGITLTSTPLALSPVPATATPTSRVSATATDTPIPTNTPVPTLKPSITPTFTWTPLPLPILPTADTSGSQPTRDPGTSGNRPTAVPPTADATVRYRETQAVLIPTLTAQATMATEEVQP